MTDCGGAPCRDWIVVLAQNGALTIWGWTVIVCATALAFVVTIALWWLIDRLT